jgi:hypothetical protein
MDYPGIEARFAVLVLYSDKVSPSDVVLSEAVRVCIGLRAGEPVELYPLSAPRKPRFRRTIFRFRHSVCRVIPASTLDMDNPVARVTPAVLDLLGLPSGSRVVIEALGRRSGQENLRSAALRALEEREGRMPLNINMPDVLDIMGSVDHPMIALDRTSREILGVTTGAAVYVRPAVLSVVADEFTSVSLVLLTIVIGAAASDAPVVAGAAALFYAVLAIGILLRRLR